MEGDLSLLSIPDLLQMICLGGYSRDIHLFDGQTQLGVIAIRNGRVDRCFGYGTWGEGAFFKLVTLRRGRYKVNDAQDMSASDATLTAYSWQELLMEAARQQDEAARVAQVSAANAGRVIPFPTPTSHGGGGGAEVMRSDTGSLSMRDASSGSAETHFDFPAIFDAPGPTSTSSSVAPTVIARSDSPRPASDTARQIPIIAAVATAQPIALAAQPAPQPEPVDRGSEDVTNLLQEATACYLRRDLDRAESLLLRCLELRPGDRRATQNLDRIRRKKSP
ncbi:MAG: DUF4388 domain-containing protein [Kofleriaceae bacterium]